MRANPWSTRTVRIENVVNEIDGVFTYLLKYVGRAVPNEYQFIPGQFNMLYLPGVGESAISMSGDPMTRDGWVHTVRIAGNVTRTLSRLQQGDTLGLRGPFGAGWPVATLQGRDIVIVAGGLGMAPLRPLIDHLINQRDQYGKVWLIFGARSPEGLLYQNEWDRWKQSGIDVQLTVDLASTGWHDSIGVVTLLVDRLRLNRPEETHLVACGPEVMMKYVAVSGVKTGDRARSHLGLARTQHAMCRRTVRPLSAGARIRLQGRACHSLRSSSTFPFCRTIVMPAKPRLAVFKFASCDGCQLSLLDAEDDLFEICDRVEIAHFAEASSDLQAGPYDIALVEGSITTKDDEKRIRDVRNNSHYLMTIGACATAGGIQALRNFSDVTSWISTVYPSPQYIQTLATSTPIAQHVHVDFELRGCPINYHQLVDVLVALTEGRQPRVPSHSVCLDCKMKKQRLSCCLAWTSVPWTSHPYRMRSDLPFISARLLRMLWPQPTGKHEFSDFPIPTIRAHQ